MLVNASEDIQVEVVGSKEEALGTARVDRSKGSGLLLTVGDM